MGPLDFLKQKLQQGVTGAENIAGGVANDVGSAVHAVGNVLGGAANAVGGAVQGAANVVGSSIGHLTNPVQTGVAIRTPPAGQPASALPGSIAPTNLASGTQSPPSLSKPLANPASTLVGNINNPAKPSAQKLLTGTNNPLPSQPPVSIAHPSSPIASFHNITDAISRIVAPRPATTTGPVNQAAGAASQVPLIGSVLKTAVHGVDAAGHFIMDAANNPASQAANIASHILLLGPAVQFAHEQGVNPPPNIIEGEKQLAAAAGGQGVANSLIGMATRTALGAAATFTPTGQISNPVTNYLTSGDAQKPELSFARAYDEASNPLDKFLAVVGPIGDALGIKGSLHGTAAEGPDVGQALGAAKERIAEANANLAANSEGGFIGGVKSNAYPEAKAAGAVSTGVDGHPKFEVDDSEARFTPADPRSQLYNQPNYTATLPEVLTHPYLYDDYPQLRNVKVEATDQLPKNQNGAFDPETGTIQINSTLTHLKQMQTVMHEAQHVIQSIEGHDSGSNPAYFDHLPSKEAFQAYKANAGETEARNVADRLGMTLEDREAAPFNSTFDVPAAEQTLDPEKNYHPAASSEDLNDSKVQHAQNQTGLDAAHKSGAISYEQYATLTRANDEALAREDVSPNLIATGLGIFKTPEDIAAERAAALEGVNAGSEEKPQTGLTDNERREIIKDNPQQQTKNQVEINVPEGNVKGAIAQAKGITDEIGARFEKATGSGSKLTPHDQNLLYRYDNGESIEGLAKEANKPKQFLAAGEQIEDAHDYALAADRAAGGLTLRQNNYLPHYYRATKEEMDALGIPEDQQFTKGKYHGFHDTNAKYGSYIKASEATNGALKPFFANPIDAIREYAEGAGKHVREQALLTALRQAAPKDIAEDRNIESDAEGRRFTQGAGHLPFNVSDEVQKSLGGLKPKTESDYWAARTFGKGFDKLNQLQKNTVLSLAFFHHVNITFNFAGATAFTHPIAGSKGIIQAIGAGLHPAAYRAIDDAFEANGTKAWERKAGVVTGHDEDISTPKTRPTSDLNKTRGAIQVANTKINPIQVLHRSMNRFIDVYSHVLSDVARRAGVDPTSVEGTKLGQEINNVVGRVNKEVLGIKPSTWKLADRTMLAPGFTYTKYRTMFDALTQWGGKNFKGFGTTNAGDLARTTVVGKRLVQAALAITGTAIATGQMPTFQSVLARGGFTPGDTHPNVDTGEKNQKGESQVVNLPTDFAGEGLEALKDPIHYGIARLSPTLASGLKIATNQDYFGNPIVDKTDLVNGKPGTVAQLIEKSALQANEPIGLQNTTNDNLSTQQKLESEFGGRPVNNFEDPQVQSGQQYFAQQAIDKNNLATGQLSKIDPSFQDDPTHGAYWADQYNQLHPANQTDINGVHIPQPWDSLSNERLPQYYLANDQKTGAQMLSPLFYIDQKAALQDPNRPHNGLFDLTGDGVGPNGDSVPKAQIALNYQNMPTGDPQRKVLEAANPWLPDYETNQAVASNNYQSTMTNFLQSEGWQQPAIDKYWSQHPNVTGPIQPPAFPQSTQDLMTQYQTITDPTQRSQFFAANADELSGAFDAEAQYVNAKRAAMGDLQLQGYPVESDNVKRILAGMPQGTDAASKKARAQLITGNPDVNQYLADVALHDATSNLSQFNYKDPRAMTATEGQLLNNGSQLSQSTLKEISGLGAYDIGKAADGTYNFMQNGVVDGSGSGGSARKPMVPLPPRLKKRTAFLKRPEKVKYSKRPYVAKVASNSANKVSIKKTSGFGSGGPLKIKA